MSQSSEHLETLQSIRDIMERSQRFISLSGLSGIGAGTCGLISSYIAYRYMSRQFSLLEESGVSDVSYIYDLTYSNWGYGTFDFFFFLAIGTLAAAVLVAFLFTYSKAKKQGRKVWDASSKRLTINFLIPLVTGGLVCLILLSRGFLGVIAPLTLVFYGLACVHGSKYTLEDVRYLGYCEIILGILALYFVGYGLLFWALGFGVLHIVYGVIWYRKYE